MSVIAPLSNAQTETTNPAHETICRRRQVDMDIRQLEDELRILKIQQNTLASISQGGKNIPGMTSCCSSQSEANNSPHSLHLLRHDKSEALCHWRIDRDIERLEQDIRALKTVRNTLAPISHLPPEILCEIFAFRIAMINLLIDNAVDWVQVSHVSGRWRETALNCTSLWRNVDLTHRKWHTEMMRRSKGGGLVLRGNLSRVDDRLVPLALFEGPRILELELHGNGRNLEKVLPKSTKIQVPMLQSLTLSVPLSDPHVRPFTLPRGILDGKMAHLRHLELGNCNIAWNRPLFGGLTSLTVRDVQDSARPTMEQLLNTLKRMPAIEVLEFKNALPFRSPVTRGMPVVDLPQLTNLVISGSTASECADFIGQIKVPIKARVYVTCDCGYIEYNDLFGILRMLCNPSAKTDNHNHDGPNSTRNLERRVIRTLHIIDRHVNMLLVNCWSRASDPPEDVELWEPDIRLTVQWSDYVLHKTMDYCTSALCNAVGVENLCSLRFDSFYTISETVWLYIFGVLPELSNVYVEGTSVYSLVAALRARVPTTTAALPSGPKAPRKKLGLLAACRKLLQSTAQRQPVYFPRLTTLYIRPLPIRVAELPLQSCMKYRSRRGVQLEELRIYHCHYLWHKTIKKVKGLRGVKRVVHVDV